jgi:hypothetical protein
MLAGQIHLHGATSAALLDEVRLIQTARLQGLLKSKASLHARACSRLVLALDTSFMQPRQYTTSNSPPPPFATCSGLYAEVKHINHA